MADPYALQTRREKFSFRLKKNDSIDVTKHDRNFKTHNINLQDCSVYKQLHKNDLQIGQLIRYKYLERIVK
jgi:hypothetical protein